MSRWSAAALAAVAGTAAGAAAAAIAAAAGADAPAAVTVPAGLCLGALVAAMMWLPASDPVVPAPEAPDGPAATASFGDLPGLRFMVEQASRDPDRFEARLRPRLTALVTELLWQQHRIDWRSETGRDAALEVLPPGLAAVMTAPPRALRLTPKTLSAWMRELEEL